jgi:hypothetical protein
MKALACVTAALGLLGTIAAANPASAAMGQCFDAYGRPFGPPHDTDNPPYGLICQAYRQGGRCTHVQYNWAVSNCGLAPRYGHRYDSYGYEYDYDDYRPRRSRHHDYRGSTPHHDYRSSTPQQRELRRLQRNSPGIYRDPATPHQSPLNTAR